MKPTKQMIEERQAFLQQWLAKMQPSIEHFINSFPPEDQQNFDYSIESLDWLEAWILKHYQNREEWSQQSLDPNGNDPVNGATYYACAVYQRYLPEARWNLDLKDTRFVSFGGTDLYGPEDNPFVIYPPVHMVAYWRRGTILRDRLELELGRSTREFRGKRRPSRITTESLKAEWLSEVEDALQYFLDWLPDEISNQLDFSPQSLDIIERWVQARCSDRMEIVGGQHPEITDGAAIYVGEVFRRALGGHWDIPMNNPTAKTYQRPIVKVRDKPALAVCPVILLWNAALTSKRLSVRKEFEKVRSKL